MIVNSNEAHTQVKTMVGELAYDRYTVHCRHCGKGYGPFDRELQIDEERKITKKVKETICDFAQRMPFEETSKMLNSYLHISMSPTSVQQISEEVGKQVFEKEKQEAEDLYENQYKAISTIPDEEKTGRINLQMDGSMVLTREEKWKEIKLGIIFKDGMILNRHKERHTL